MPLFYLGLAGHGVDTTFKMLCLWIFITFFIWVIPISSTVWCNWTWFSDAKIDWEQQVVLVTGVRSNSVSDRERI